MGSSQYTDTITLLQSHISLYWQEFEGGYLPPNLRLHGLANSIHQNSQARLRGFSDPHAHHLTGNTTLIQGLPITYSPHMYRVRNDRPQGGSLNSGPGQRGDSYGRCGNDSWTGWGGNSRFVGDYGDNCLSDNGWFNNSPSHEPRHPVPVADLEAPTAWLGPTAIAAPSSRAFNAPHVAASATWLNSATCLPWPFVSSAT